MDDKAMLKWLNQQALQSVVSIEAIRDIGLGGFADARSMAYRQGMRLQLFTEGSQHVYGRDLWDAINTAVATAKLRHPNG